MYGELGFASAEDMIRNGYGLEPAEIALVVEWWRLKPPDEPIELEQRAKEHPPEDDPGIPDFLRRAP